MMNVEEKLFFVKTFNHVFVSYLVTISHLLSFAVRNGTVVMMVLGWERFEAYFV